MKRGRWRRTGPRDIEIQYNGKWWPYRYDFRDDGQKLLIWAYNEDTGWDEHASIYYRE